MWIRTIENELLNLDKISTISVANRTDTICIYAEVASPYREYLIQKCDSKEQARKLMNNIAEHIRIKTNYIDTNQIKLDIGE